MQIPNKPTACQEYLKRKLAGETADEALRYEFEGRGAPEAKILERSPVTAYLAEELQKIRQVNE